MYGVLPSIPGCNGMTPYTESKRILIDTADETVVVGRPGVDAELAAQVIHEAEAVVAVVDAEGRRKYLLFHFRYHSRYYNNRLQ